MNETDAQFDAYEEEKAMRRSDPGSAFFAGWSKALRYASKHGYTPPKERCPVLLTSYRKNGQIDRWLCVRDANHSTPHWFEGANGYNNAEVTNL